MKIDETAGGNLHQGPLGVEEAEVFLRIIRLRSQATLSRSVRIAHPLATFDDVLHVDVLAMRFPFGFLGRLGLIPLHNGKEPFAIERMPAVGQFPQVGLLQVIQGACDIDGQRAVETSRVRVGPESCYHSHVSMSRDRVAEADATARHRIRWPILVNSADPVKRLKVAACAARAVCLEIAVHPDAAT